jgi:hypothetical protein
MDEDQLSKAEFLADFFCSNLAKEVYKSLSNVSSNDEIAESLVNFANKLWNEIKEAMEEDGDDADY